MIGIVAGSVLSWIITYWYYQKSSTNVPEWAKPLIEKLPDSPISIERLVDLYHDAIESGDVTPHPSGYIKCSECGAGSDYFEPWQVGVPELDSIFHGYKCAKCNYELTSEQD